MQQEIHPTYYKDTKVVCACGNTFTTGSTKSEIHVEICSNCHPFYTGSAKFIDTEGRVERFQRQQKEATQTTEAIKQKKETKQKEKEEQTRPQSLREMMELLKKQQ